MSHLHVFSLGVGVRNVFRPIGHKLDPALFLRVRVELSDKRIPVQMTCHILACGPSGEFYKRQPDDFVIGVNDAGKWGHKIDELVFINRPRHFLATKYQADRLQIIKATKVTQIVTVRDLTEKWKEYFPTTHVYQLPNIVKWHGKIDPGVFYCTNNSPFTAMSYALTLGFTDIILHGVDFVDHRWIKAPEAAPAYSEFAMRSIHLGCAIWKGHKMSRLNLPIWNSTTNS